jgi:hypothetical protein
MKIAVFWVVAPCSLVEVYQRFRGPCSHQQQTTLHGATTQKTAIFILTAVRTSNPTQIMFENRVVRRILGPKRDEVTGVEELHN